MSALLLVRYGELALKSPPVRREFERTLQRNVLDQFAAAGLACRLRSDAGHLYVEADEPEAALRLVRRVFGVTSASEVFEVPTDPARIAEEAIRLLDPLLASGRSFAIRARRTGQHAFTSQELAGSIGAGVLARFPERGLRVDLTKPEVELYVEVRDNRTYLSTGREKGPGGLPLGVAGRVVALVDGRRGALGAYLLMKRGCRTTLVATAEGAPLVASVLSKFDPKAPLGPAVEPGTAAEEALQALADQSHADGIVLPLRVEEFSEAKVRWGDRVVFSPTVGLTDEEVDGRWRAVAQLAA